MDNQVKNIAKNMAILIAKIVVIIVIVGLVYIYLGKADNELVKAREFEHFSNAIKADKNKYIKYAETSMIDNTETASPKPLLDSGAQIWEKKTLMQCIDNCNDNKNCIGFTRDKSNDKELATCYPYSNLTKCHTSVKGDDTQRNYALQYDTYFKSDVDKSVVRHINMCLGGNEDSIGKSGRMVLIKSVSQPDYFIGCQSSRVILVSNMDADFMNSCKLRIRYGLYGSGTVSIQHEATGKYLYRSLPDSNNNEYITATASGNNNTTMEDQLRSSFHIIDSIALYIDTQKYDAISIQCSPVRTEVASQDYKYITVDTNGSSITAKTMSNESELQKAQSYILVDYSEYMNDSKSSTSINISDPNVKNTNEFKIDKRTPSLKSRIGINDNISIKKKKEKYLDVDNNNSNDSTNTNDEYMRSIFRVGINMNDNTQSNNAFFDEISKYYNKNLPDNDKLSVDLQVQKKLYDKSNEMMQKNKIGTILGQNELKYQAYAATANEIESELENKSNILNEKYNGVISKLDRMRMEDMASDLNFLQNIDKLKSL